MSFRDNILRVFSANFLSMISGIIIGFIVPAILSLESYSYVKTYMFYISYVGILHFGFTDGMYIKYGGKNIKEINKNELKCEHRIYITIQIIMTIIFIIIGLINNDIIIILLGISILPTNALSFYRLLYQATGQFNKYAKMSYLYNVMNLSLNIILALILKSDNYIYYCLISFISNFVVYIMLELDFNRVISGVEIKYNSTVWNNIRIGFFVMLGNLSVLLFYAIDRWFIKIFLSVNDFAYYSFAVSMLNVINLLVNSISITFYNYLAKGENKEKIKKIKKYFLILGGFASGGYFIFDCIVSLFIKKYIPALSIISISFASYPYMIIITALYVNLYKARKNEKKYFKVVIGMLIISLLYNIIAIYVFGTSESIAIATILSFITWYIYSMKDFNYLKADINEVIYLTIILLLFLVFSHYFNWFIGGVLYLLSLIIIDFVFFKKEINEVVNIILKK